MDQPRTRRLIGGDDDVDALPGGDRDRILRSSRVATSLRIAGDDLLIVPDEVCAVWSALRQVELCPADTKPLAALHFKGLRRGILLPVHRPVILGGTLDRPGREHLDEIVREPSLFRTRMRGKHDDRPVQARIEMRLATVRVIHERPGSVGDEAIQETTALGDQRLRDPGDAVHRDRNLVDAVHVNGVGHGGEIAIVDLDRVALIDHENRARNDAVVGVGHNGQARAQRPGRGALDQVEGLGFPAHRRNGLIRSVRAENRPRLAGGWCRGGDRTGERLHADGRRIDPHGGHIVGVAARGGWEDEERRKQREQGQRGQVDATHRGRSSSPDSASPNQWIRLS